MFEKAKRKKLNAMKSELDQKIVFTTRKCNDLMRVCDVTDNEIKGMKQKALAALKAGNEMGARKICSEIQIKKRKHDLNHVLYKAMLQINEGLAYKKQRLEFDDVLSDFSKTLKEFKAIDVNMDLSDFRNAIGQIDDEMTLLTNNLNSVTFSEKEDDVFNELVKELENQQGISAVDSLTTDGLGIDQQNPEKKYV